MSIKDFKYSKTRLNRTGLVFDAEIEEDIWTLYHGTSSIAEAKIEDEGLGQKSHNYTLGEINRVLTIFDGLYWEGDLLEPGDGFRGYGVLKNFSGFNYDSNERTKTFFHPMPRFLHSSQDFSGGETARALRHCFSQLREYLAKIKQETLLVRMWKNILSKQIWINSSPGDGTETVEQRLHRLKKYKDEDITNELLEHVKHGLRSEFKWPESRFPQEPSQERLEIPDDAEWLRVGLEGVKEIEKRCQKPRDKFKYGIIYAVKFRKADITKLTLDGDKSRSMGIYTSGLIPPERLIAKVVIPAGKNPKEMGWDPRLPSSPGYQKHQARKKKKLRAGIYKRLQKRQKKKNPRLKN